MMCLECYYETGSEDVLKIDRLIGILSILLQKEKVTTPELTERFEVLRRTINRDIENLCKAGIPISTTQGVGGEIRFHYYAPNGESTREIEPHFLILSGAVGMSGGGAG